MHLHPQSPQMATINATRILGILQKHQNTSFSRNHTCRSFNHGTDPAIIQSDISIDHHTPMPSRRAVMAAIPSLLALAAISPQSALAFTPPPPGLRYHQDKLDGYSFFYPEDWLPVTTSGNDIFYRNPFNAEENLFVDVSSPSSSRFESVTDLGSPEAAAKTTLDQYFEEFMSTRIGVKRTGEIVSATQRTGTDGKLYYDIQTRVKSYASRNQLAVTQVEIDDGVVLEWDRLYLTVLGVANKRLYSFRIQASDAAFAKDSDRFLSIASSFTCKDVVVA